MAVTFGQTSAGVTGLSQAESVGCSGGTSYAGFSGITCEYNQPPNGSGTTDISAPSSASGVASLVFGCTGAGSLSWDAGDWVVRFNVTSSNMNLTVTAIYVCRANSSWTNVETLGSATGLSISLATTGVKSQTVTCSGTTPVSTDNVLIVLLHNNGAMSVQQYTITLDQDIDSPFTAVTAPQPNVNDSITVTESVTARMNPMLFNVFDSVTLTEATQRNMLLFPQPFDTVTVTENITTNLVNNIGVFDSVTVTESARVHILVMPVVFDSVTVAEQVTTLLNKLNIEANDSVTLTESVSITFQEAGGAITVNVSDNVTVADDTVRVHIYVMPTVSDSVTVTEQTQFNMKVMPSVNDAVTVAEQTQMNVKVMPSIFDGVTVTDAPQMNMLVMPSVFDTVTTTESVTVSVVNVSALQISASDTITVADALTVVVVGDAPPPPDSGQTPAGRASRRIRRERFIARYKGQEYSFDSPEQLEAFVESIRTPAQKRRGKKPSVKIVVPQRVERELAQFDLPSIQAELARFDWRAAIRTWNRYEALRQSQGLDLNEAQRHQDYILARQIELEDEELMLL
jgi:hypothetical protein